MLPTVLVLVLGFDNKKIDPHDETGLSKNLQVVRRAGQELGKPNKDIGSASKRLSTATRAVHPLMSRSSSLSSRSSRSMSTADRLPRATSTTNDTTVLARKSHVAQ